MTTLILSAAPFIAVIAPQAAASPKIRALRRWIKTLAQRIAEARMRQVERELQRHGFVARPQQD